MQVRQSATIHCLQGPTTLFGTNGSETRISKIRWLWTKVMGRTPILITRYYDAENGMITLPLRCRGLKKVML
ncbi:hypothetical protein [Marine gokushovirus]|nr:hypothetical protein [Marine gokushovirus]